MFESEGGNTLSIETSPLLEGGALLGHGARELLVGHGKAPGGAGLDDEHAVLADRPHRQLRLYRNADLANDDHVQGPPQHSCDLEGDGYPSSWETEHDRVALTEHFGESGTQATSRVASILERLHVSGLLRAGGTAKEKPNQ